jgi:hypothetical protein
MKDQERIKFKRGTSKPMRSRKVSSMTNSRKQQNLKVSNFKSKDQLTQVSIWTNTGISKYLSIIILNVNGLNSQE